MVQVHVRIWFFAVFLTLAAGCDDPPSKAPALVRNVHAEEAVDTIHDDIDFLMTGTCAAAKKMGQGLDVNAPEKELRAALRILRAPPPRGLSELAGAAISFLAVLDANGVVLARDMKDEERDLMQGQNYAARYDVVGDALKEVTNKHALVEFPALEDEADSSWSYVFVCPIVRDGELIGAAMSGIPLQRWANRLRRKGLLDHVDEPGLQYAVFFYRGEREFHPKEGAAVIVGLPEAAKRKAGLAKSPGGFTGEFTLASEHYAYGVLPIPSLGRDTGVMIVRNEPKPKETPR